MEKSSLSKKIVGLNFDINITDRKDINNPSFDVAKIGIAYAGKNRNKSKISKESFDRALPTLKNVPLVGRYIPEEKDFGSHDIKISVDSETGDVVVNNATTPFGVVPESARQWWEEVREEDGTVREYLFTDCILWKRQEGYDTLVSQAHWNQSMEIEISSYIESGDGYMDIQDFSWSALCILGNNVQPCFESASVQIGNGYTSSNLSEYSDASCSNMNIDFAKIFDEEGGVSEMGRLTDETRDAILAEYEVSLDEITFSIEEDMTEDGLRLALERMKCSRLESEIATLTATNSELSAELETLRDIQEEYNIACHQADVEEVLVEFNDLIGIPEFDALVEGDEESSYHAPAYQYDDLEELREKCYAIRGKNTKVATEKPKTDHNTFSARQKISGDDNVSQTTTSKYDDIYALYRR